MSETVNGMDEQKAKRGEVEGRRGGGECLHNEIEVLHNGVTPICILWGIRPLHNGPIKENNVVY